jgi:hypothetical protein
LSLWRLKSAFLVNLLHWSFPLLTVYRYAKIYDGKSIINDKKKASAKWARRVNYILVNIYTVIIVCSSCSPITTL